MGKLYAAFTGDLVLSSHLPTPELDRAREAVAEAHRRLGAVAGAAQSSALDFFRGDGFQFILDSPSPALRAALLLQSHLFASTGVEVRLSVGIGTLEIFDEAQTERSRGAAVLLSGRGLDAMAKWRRLAASCETGNDVLHRLTPALFALCNAVLSRGTRRQNENFALALAHPGATLGALGEMLVPKVSKQTVERSLSALLWTPVSEAVSAFEAIDWSSV